MTYPSIYPTGTTIFDPDRCWSGYTIYQAKDVGVNRGQMGGGSSGQHIRICKLPIFRQGDGSRA